jgi:uncharacterized repeat protein (TIGR02543 family)
MNNLGQRKRSRQISSKALAIILAMTMMVTVMVPVGLYADDVTGPSIEAPSDTGDGSESGTGDGTETGTEPGEGTEPGDGEGTDPGTGEGTDPGDGEGTDPGDLEDEEGDLEDEEGDLEDEEALEEEEEEDLDLLARTIGGPGIVRVETWDDLRQAITDANSGLAVGVLGGPTAPINTIILATDISRSTTSTAERNAALDLPAITVPLTIDGWDGTAIHTLRFDNNNGADYDIGRTGIRVSSANPFTIQNIHLRSGNSGTANGEDTIITATTATTINIKNVDAAGTNVIQLVYANNATAVNVTGNLTWATTRNISAIYVNGTGTINFGDGTNPVTVSLGKTSGALATVISNGGTININPSAIVNITHSDGGGINAGTGTVNITSATLAITSTATSGTHLSLGTTGSTLNLTNATLTINNVSSGSSAHGIVVKQFNSNNSTVTVNTNGGIPLSLEASGTTEIGLNIHSGSVVNVTTSNGANAIAANSGDSKVTFRVDGARTIVNANLNTSSANDNYTVNDGTGAIKVATGANNSGSSITVSGGAQLNAVATGQRRAMLVRLDHGVFDFTGEGTRMYLHSAGNSSETFGTLHFAYVGDMTFNIKDKAELVIIQDALASTAVRMRGGNNIFNVESGGKVYVRHNATGTNTDGLNFQAIQYATGGGNEFNVTGEDSLVELVSGNGPALSADGTVTINLSDHALFRAEGNLRNANFTNLPVGIFYSTAVLTFKANNPEFFDFVNNSQKKVFYCPAGSTFEITNSDIALWPIGRSVTLDPTLQWNKITASANGANFITIPAGASDPSFNQTILNAGSTYSGVTGFRNYDRISGNNAPPISDGMTQDLTNLDRFVRAQGRVAESYYFNEATKSFERVYRPLWDDEAVVTFTRNGSETLTGTSVFHDPLYTQEVTGTVLDGVARYDAGAGNTLKAGDTYTLTNLTLDGNPALQGLGDSKTVIDKMPPAPGTINNLHLYANQKNLTGTWSLDPAVYGDNQPTKVYAAINDTVIKDGSGNEVYFEVAPSATGSGTWSYAIPTTQVLAAGDVVTILLEDAYGNRNPINDTPARDVILPHGVKITVEAVAFEISGKAVIIGIDEAQAITTILDLKTLIEAKGYDLSLPGLPGDPGALTSVSINDGGFKYGAAAAAGTYQVTVSVDADPTFTEVYDVVVKPGKVVNKDGYTIIYTDITTRHNFQQAQDVTGAQLLVKAAVSGEKNEEIIENGNHHTFITTPKAVNYDALYDKTGFSYDTNSTNDTFKVYIVEKTDVVADIHINIDNGNAPEIQDNAGNPLADLVLGLNATLNLRNNVKAIDDYDGDVTSSIQLFFGDASSTTPYVNQIDTSVKGAYKVTYRVTDSDDNESFVVRLVTVGYTVGTKYIYDAEGFAISSSLVADTSNDTKSAQIRTESGAYVLNKDTLAPVSTDLLIVTAGLNNYTKIADNADPKKVPLTLAINDPLETGAPINILALIVPGTDRGGDRYAGVYAGTTEKRVGQVTTLLAKTSAEIATDLKSKAWLNASGYRAVTDSEGRIIDYTTNVAIGVQTPYGTVASAGNWAEVFYLITDPPLLTPVTATGHVQVGAGDKPVFHDTFPSPYLISYGSYSGEFDPREGLSVTDTEDNLDPVATSKGFPKYVVDSITLMDTDTGTLKSIIDTTVDGVYVIRYTAEDYDNQHESYTRIVVVDDQYGSYDVGRKFIVKAKPFALTKIDAKALYDGKSVAEINAAILTLSGARAWSASSANPGVRTNPIVVPGSNTNGFYNDALNVHPDKTDYPFTIGVANDDNDGVPYPNPDDKAERSTVGTVINRTVIVVTPDYYLAADPIQKNTTEIQDATGSTLYGYAKPIALNRAANNASAGVEFASWPATYFTGSPARVPSWERGEIADRALLKYQSTGPDHLDGVTFRVTAAPTNVIHVSIRITDGSKPIIGFNHQVVLAKGDTFNYALADKAGLPRNIGITDAEDDLDASINLYDAAHLTYNTPVNTAVAGVYYVTYTVTDSDNNTASETLEVTVKDRTIEIGTHYIVQADNYAILLKVLQARGSDATKVRAEIIANGGVKVGDILYPVRIWNRDTKAELLGADKEAALKISYPEAYRTAPVAETSYPISIWGEDAVNGKDNASQRNITATVIPGDIIVIEDEYIITAKNVERTVPEMVTAFPTLATTILTADWADVRAYNRANITPAGRLGVALGANDITTALGNYYAVYRISDVTNAPGITTSTPLPTSGLEYAHVDVRDGSEPVLTINPRIVEIPLNGTYIYDDTTGVTVFDPDDNFVRGSNPLLGGANGLTWTPTVDPTVDGVYTVTYTATDSQGKTDVETRTVVVNDGSYIVQDGYIIRAKSFVTKAIDVQGAGSDLQNFIKTNANVKAWIGWPLQETLAIVTVGAGALEAAAYGSTFPATVDLKVAVDANPSVARDIKAKVVNNQIVEPPVGPGYGYFIVADPILIDSTTDQNILTKYSGNVTAAWAELITLGHAQAFRNDNNLTPGVVSVTNYTGVFDGTQGYFGTTLSVPAITSPPSAATTGNTYTNANFVRVFDGNKPEVRFSSTTFAGNPVKVPFDPKTQQSATFAEWDGVLFYDFEDSNPATPDSLGYYRAHEYRTYGSTGTPLDLTKSGTYVVSYRYQDSNYNWSAWTDRVVIVGNVVVGNIYAIDADAFSIASADIAAEAGKDAQIKTNSDARVWLVATGALLNPAIIAVANKTGYTPIPDADPTLYKQINVTLNIPVNPALGVNVADPLATISPRVTITKGGIVRGTRYDITADDYSTTPTEVRGYANINNSVIEKAGAVAFDKWDNYAVVTNIAVTYDSVGPVSEARNTYHPTFTVSGETEPAFWVSPPPYIKAAITRDFVVAGGHAPKINFVKGLVEKIYLQDTLDPLALVNTVTDEDQITPLNPTGEFSKVTGNLRVTGYFKPNAGGGRTAITEIPTDASGKLNEAGVYIIEYEVTDNDGDKGTNHLVLVVNDGTFKVGYKNIIRAQNFALTKIDADLLDPSINNTNILNLAGAEAYDGSSGLVATPYVITDHAADGVYGNPNGFYASSTFAAKDAADGTVDGIVRYPFAIGVIGDDDVWTQPGLGQPEVAMKNIEGVVIDKLIVIQTFNYILYGDAAQISPDQENGITDAELITATGAGALRRGGSAAATNVDIIVPAGRVNGYTGFREGPYYDGAGDPTDHLGNFKLNVVVAPYNTPTPTADDKAQFNVLVVEGYPPTVSTKLFDVVDVNSGPYNYITGANAVTASDPDGTTEAELLATLQYNNTAVNTAVVGVYTVTFKVTDKSGLESAPVTRVVVVTDGTIVIGDNYLVQARNFLALKGKVTGKDAEILANSKARVWLKATGAIQNNNILSVDPGTGLAKYRDEVGTYPIRVYVAGDALASRYIFGKVVTGDVIDTTDDNYVISARTPVLKTTVEITTQFLTNKNVIFTPTWGNVLAYKTADIGTAAEAALPVSLFEINTVAAAPGDYAVRYSINEKPAVLVNGVVRVSNGNAPTIDVIPFIEVTKGSTTTFDYEKKPDGTTPIYTAHDDDDDIVSITHAPLTGSRTVDMTVDGVYYEQYTVTDSEGSTATGILTILVNDGSYKYDANYIVRAKSFVIEGPKVLAAGDKAALVKTYGRILAWSINEHKLVDASVSYGTPVFEGVVGTYDIHVNVTADPSVARDIHAQVVGDKIVVPPFNPNALDETKATAGYFLIGNDIKINSKAYLTVTDPQQFAQATIAVPILGTVNLGNVRAVLNVDALAPSAVTASDFTGTIGVFTSGSSADYTIKFTAAADATAQLSLKITVDDGTKPWIETSMAHVLIDPATGTATFNELSGVTAYDAEDKPKGGPILYEPTITVVDKNYDLTKEGLYWIDYQAEDHDLQKSEVVRRGVWVDDGNGTEGDYYILFANGFTIRDVDLAAEAGKDAQILTETKAYAKVKDTFTDGSGVKHLAGELAPVGSILVTERANYTNLTAGQYYKTFNVTVGMPVLDPKASRQPPVAITGDGGTDGKYFVGANPFTLRAGEAASITNTDILARSHAYALDIRDPNAFVAVTPEVITHDIVGSVGTYNVTYGALPQTGITDLTKRATYTSTAVVADAGNPWIVTSMAHLVIDKATGTAAWAVDEFDGVTAYDDEDKPIAGPIVVEPIITVVDRDPSLDLTVEGIYWIDYQATDSDGQTSVIERRGVWVDGGNGTEGTNYVLFGEGFQIKSADVAPEAGRDAQILTRTKAYAQVKTGPNAGQLANASDIYVSERAQYTELASGEYFRTLKVTLEMTKAIEPSAVRQAPVAITGEGSGNGDYFVGAEKVYLRISEVRTLDDATLLTLSHAYAIDIRDTNNYVAVDPEVIDRSGILDANGDYTAKYGALAEHGNALAGRAQYDGDVKVQDGDQPWIVTSMLKLTIDPLTGTAVWPTPDGKFTGVTAYDNQDKPFGGTVVREPVITIVAEDPSLDLAKEGFYWIDYRAQDGDDQYSDVVRRSIWVDDGNGNEGATYVLFANGFTIRSVDLADDAGKDAQILTETKAYASLKETYTDGAGVVHLAGERAPVGSIEVTERADYTPLIAGQYFKTLTVTIEMDKTIEPNAKREPPVAITGNGGTDGKYFVGAEAFSLRVGEAATITNAEILARSHAYALDIRNPNAYVAVDPEVITHDTFGGYGIYNVTYGALPQTGITDLTKRATYTTTVTVVEGDKPWIVTEMAHLVIDKATGTAAWTVDEFDGIKTYDLNDYPDDTSTGTPPTPSIVGYSSDYDLTVEGLYWIDYQAKDSDDEFMATPYRRGVWVDGGNGTEGDNYILFGEGFQIKSADIAPDAGKDAQILTKTKAYAKVKNGPNAGQLANPADIYVSDKTQYTVLASGEYFKTVKVTLEMNKTIEPSAVRQAPVAITGEGGGNGDYFVGADKVYLRIGEVLTLTDATLLSLAHAYAIDMRDPSNYVGVPADVISHDITDANGPYTATYGAAPEAAVDPTLRASYGYLGDVEVVDGDQPWIETSMLKLIIDPLTGTAVWPAGGKFAGVTAYDNQDKPFGGTLIREPDITIVAEDPNLDLTIEGTYWIDYRAQDGDRQYSDVVRRTIWVDGGNGFEGATYILIANGFTIKSTDVADDSGREAQILSRTNASATVKDTYTDTLGVKHLAGEAAPAGSIRVTERDSYRPLEATEQYRTLTVTIEMPGVDPTAKRQPPVAITGDGGTDGKYFVGADAFGPILPTYAAIITDAQILAQSHAYAIDIRDTNNYVAVPAEVIAHTIVSAEGTWTATYGAQPQHAVGTDLTRRAHYTANVTVSKDPTGGNAPVINAPATKIALNAVWDIKTGVTVTDVEDDALYGPGTLNGSVILTPGTTWASGVDTSVEGVYNLKYEVEDSDGHKGYVTRAVLVGDGVIGDHYIMKLDKSFTLTVWDVKSTDLEKKAQAVDESNVRLWNIDDLTVGAVEVVPASTVPGGFNVTLGGYTNARNNYTIGITVATDPKATSTTVADVTARDFRVTYNVNNSSGASYVSPPYTVYTEPNTTVMDNPPIPTRPGYDFNGWTTTTGGSYGPGYVVTSNITVYANWTLIPPPPQPPIIITPPPTTTIYYPTTIVREIINSLIPAELLPVPEPISIPEEPVPEAAPLYSWSLVNLILALLGIELLIFMMILWARNKDEYGNELTKRNRVGYIVMIVTGIVNIVLFIFTQPPLTNPMALTDQWTIPTAILCAATVYASILTGKRSENTELNA